MREIKFRGKGALSGHWEYGFLTKKKTRRNKEINFAIAVGDCSLANTIPVHADTVGQFTGLVDDEDKDIYEGDILDGYKINGFVCWNYDRWGVHYIDAPGQPLSWLIETYSCRIIGNIHDNPELLEANNGEDNH